MTLYIAAYDTEHPACLAACRKIVDVHRRFEMPATFFIQGQRLDEHRAEYRELLDDPLFEIASHTWSHKMLRDHPICGPAASPEEIHEEIVRGVGIVEDVFERPCIGLRAGCCFVDGLRGAPDILAVVAEAGLRYVGTVAWGRDFSLPAPLNQPFSYADDGYPDIWELPAHGWHENLLKDNNRMGPARLTLWPPEMPEAIPPRFLETPDEEFDVNKIFLDRAARDALTFVSLIWHPWSLDRFDPDMRMLELTFAYVKELGLEPTTYGGLHARVSGA
jgi:peptidoglycan/xylan/chitin deacetylase (PgdA/CDA1 family)